MRGSTHTRGIVYAHVRSNVVGYLTIFAFAMTGTAQAVDGPLPGTDQVGSEDIIDNEVRSADITDGTVTNLDFADNSLRPPRIQDATLTGPDVAANTLTTAHILDGALFNDNSLTSADIDEATLFNDNSLTAADLASNSVGSSEISTGAIRSSEVEDDSLTSFDIGPGQVGSSEIAGGSVQASELASVTREIDGDEVAPGQEKTLTVFCGPGDIAIGGEASMDELGREGPRTFASFPVRSDNFLPASGEPFTGWRGLFKNEDNVPLNAFVQVLCLD